PVTSCVCPTRLAAILTEEMSRLPPVIPLTSHIWIERSQVPTESQRPSGLKVALYPPIPVPTSPRGCPSGNDQKRILNCRSTLTATVPSRVMASPATSPLHCPDATFVQRELDVGSCRQKRTFSSSPQLTSVLPSGVISISFTGPMCAGS